MSMQHHETVSGRSEYLAETDHEKLFRRYREQQAGTSKPEYPNGKLDEQDEGELIFRISADTANGVIRIEFPKPVVSGAMDADSAEKLRDLLTEKIWELRGIKG